MSLISKIAAVGKQQAKSDAQGKIAIFGAPIVTKAAFASYFKNPKKLALTGAALAAVAAGAIGLSRMGNGSAEASK